jgi:hypothetical protein
MMVQEMQGGGSRVSNSTHLAQNFVQSTHTSANSSIGTEVAETSPKAHQHTSQAPKMHIALPDNIALEHAGRHFQNVDELCSSAPRVSASNKTSGSNST